MVNEISDLVFMCKSIGNNVELTQGAGANASVKNESQMWIKASGFNLQDVTLEDGHITVDHKKIRSFYQNSNGDEDSAREVLRSSILDQENRLRPSIETGFHSYLPRCVLHTHPIFLNVLSSLEQGFPLDALEKLDHPIVIDYTKVGHELAKEIYRNLNNNRDNSSIILRNHGLIVSGEDPIECVKRTIEIEEISRDFVLLRTGIHFEPYILPETFEHEGNVGFLGGDLIEPSPGNYMFPDAAVFLNDLSKNPNVKIVDGRPFYDMSYRNTRKIDEILYANRQILRFSQYLGTPRKLTKRETSDLLDMREEKYRQER